MRLRIASHATEIAVNSSRKLRALNATIEARNLCMGVDRQEHEQAHQEQKQE